MLRRTLWVALLLASACRTASPEPTPAPAPSPAPAPAPSAAPEKPRDPNTAHLQIVGLSDFHGWLMPLEPKGFPNYFGGIANIAGFLRHRDKLDEATSLVLDNGDMFTGPTESTVLRGESVIRAYNLLGVDAANIANHEFDFGVEVLKARVEEAKFPFLGANIFEAGTERQPSFLLPWVLLERDGVKIGVLGLSYRDTPRTTQPKHVAGLEFRAYGDILTAQVAELKRQGAEVLVVLFHDTVEVVAETLAKTPGLGIHAIVAGQNHRKGTREVDGTIVVNPGGFGRAYVRFDIDVDRKTRAVTKVGYELVDVTGEIGAPAAPPDPALLQVALAAKEKAAQLAGEVVGELEQPLSVGSFADSPAGNFVTDAWLAAYPDADGAISNHGALRQPLPQGPVTNGDIVSLLPFENNLYIVKLTGKTLKEQLAIDGPVVAGFTFEYKMQGDLRTVTAVKDRNGKVIPDNKPVRVVINDFMYHGGDGFTFKEVDPSPEDTGLSMREPLLRALRDAKARGEALRTKTGARAFKR